MTTLLSENWIEKVQLDNFASPPSMTTLKFGEKQMIYANVSRLAIQFPKSWEFFKKMKGNEQSYGCIQFGVFDCYDDEITSDFSICVKKEVIDFFNANYNKLFRSRNNQLHQTIKEKFGLDMELSILSDNAIYFNLFSDTDRIIDFGELANLLFQQIGLVD